LDTVTSIFLPRSSKSLLPVPQEELCGPVIFSVVNFHHFAIKKIKLKTNILSQIPCFERSGQKRKILKSPKIAKSQHNCQKYERVLKIFHFHILNIAEFGYI
jgi:hypothetical protein